MKSLFIILTAMIFVSACSEQKKQEITTKSSLDSINMEYKKRMEVTFPVGKENFNKLVAYIVKHGRLIDEFLPPYSSEFNFTDSKGNCHNFLALRSTEDEQIHQIKVWVFSEDPRFAKKDPEIFGRYLITQKGASPQLGEGIMLKAKVGYMELLELASR